ncbi:MAG TPA: metalloregulator ArsR/SmtB family transcription factor [Verrucomicrobiae bacterium]|nr:metalloregulator ArsR/SmtB family transcription factor [Verrucomicrobiae bacterium]
METIAIAKKPDPARPLPDYERLLNVISHSARWRILRALCTGEAMTVTQLADDLGISVDMSSKHLKVLKNAGLIERKRNRLYTLTAAYQLAPGEPLLDFGHCVLRLDAADAKPAS